MSLATDYRPKEFSEVISQQVVVKILEKQIEKQQYSNCYLFAGPSGCGKTTLARILANKINEGEALPIEKDAASNGGVDAVRSIINSLNEFAISGKYKIYIIDECHMLTTAGWNALLKTLEDTPKRAILMFCTTNPEKIPVTVLNRVMRFNLSKVDVNLIAERLKYICQQEGFTNFEESCDYIAKLANGGVRDAIAMLEKCANYSNDLNITNVLSCLGNFSYNSFFDLSNAIYDGDEGMVLSIIDYFYNSGSDLKLFTEQYLDFVLDLTKYCIFQDMACLKIPASLEEKVKYATGFDNNLHWFNSLVDKVLDIKNTIKYDVNNKTTIEAMLIGMCRGN